MSRRRIERRISYRAEEHCVGSCYGVPRLPRKRIAFVLNSGSADRVVGSEEGHSGTLRCRRQYPLGLGRDLRADPVAWKNRNVHASAFHQVVQSNPAPLEVEDLRLQLESPSNLIESFEQRLPPVLVEREPGAEPRLVANLQGDQVNRQTVGIGRSRFPTEQLGHFVGLEDYGKDSVLTAITEKDVGEALAQDR